VITALFAVGRYLIATYLAHRRGLGLRRGRFAGGDLVWIYWSAQIFLFGACVLRVQHPPATA
jgi:uncharacterized BrkB/YihY/UPF0761 family membrane protein